MEKVYLLLGESSYLIKERIEKIKEEFGRDELNINKFDAEETHLNDILLELQTLSFFGDKKLIVVENVEAFNKYSEHDLESFIHYIKNPSDDIVLILTLHDFPKSVHLKDALEKYTYIETIKDLEENALPLYLYKIFSKDGYQIDSKTLKALIERVGVDLFLLNQEIEKLKTYKLHEKRITIDDIYQLVPRTLEDNIFVFMKAFLKEDTKMYLSIYDDLIQSKIPVLTIMNQLYSNLSLILQIQYLIEDGHKQESIQNFLGLSSGRTYYLMKDAKEQNKKQIERIIKDLAILDYEIKTGQKEDKLGFELLLMKRV